jgi:hypothetical protein
MSSGEEQWQPSMLLPDMTHQVGLQQLRELREEALRLPTDILVVLVSSVSSLQHGERGE